MPNTSENDQEGGIADFIKKHCVAIATLLIALVGGIPGFISVYTRLWPFGNGPLADQVRAGRCCAEIR
jgi:hypothetical protein